LPFVYGPNLGYLNWEFYALGEGPVLLGPFPVVIQRQDDPEQPGFGRYFIQVPEGPASEKYPYWGVCAGRPNRWGNAGYYLRFFPKGTEVRFVSRASALSRSV
jgi:hypothetical protein